MASVIGPISAALKAVTGLIQSGAGAVSSALGLLAAPLLAVSSTAGALGPLVGGGGGESAMPMPNESASANVTNHADVVVALEPPLESVIAAPKAHQLQFEQFNGFNGGVRHHMRRSRVKSNPKRRSSSLKRTRDSVKGRSKPRSRASRASRARGTTK